VAIAYITNNGNNTVTAVDLSAQTISATINVGKEPFGSAITPDGTKVYVTNNDAGTVSVINTSNNTVSATITVGTGPNGVAVSPDGTKAYVANGHIQGGSGTDNRVSVINTSNNTISATITVGNYAWGIAVSPDGSKVYVANNSPGTVSVINTSNNTVSATITVGSAPYGVAISPDGTKVYVTDDVSPGTVSVINTSNNTVSATITVGTDPHGVAFTPDGTKAYVANSGAGTVSVINTSNNTVTATITVNGGPEGIQVALGGTRAYVALGSSNDVAVIDVASDTKVTTIVTGATGSVPDAFGTFIQPTSTSMTNIYTLPQGRLTLNSNTPVMTADATAQTSVYYTPYQGNIVPIYDGTNTQSYTFSQLTMALSTTNQTSGNIYDLFIFLNSSVVTIGAGPAWSSSSSRGTGAGTTELQQTNGLWTNKNSITLTNGSSSYSSISAGQATYVGSVYMTANGQTGMQFTPAAASGGSNNILGLYNAYNRINTKSVEQESTSSWTYSSSTVRAANNSSSNKISFVDGLQQSFIDASYEMYMSAGGAGGGIGLQIDSSTSCSVIEFNAPSAASSIMAHDDYKPVLGLHSVYAVEANGNNTTTSTYYSSGTVGQFMKLTVALDM